jgi:hypothetical protein
VALLERGLAANPNQWEYMHDIGFVYYWWIQDYKAAAQWFDKAGKLPGAADWLPALAATTLAEGGDRRSSRLLWRQLFETSEADWTRRTAEHRLLQLDAMDMLDRLNGLSQQFMAREGRPPRTGGELLAGTGITAVPVDPTGTPFIIDQATGGITLARQSKLWPLPIDKHVSRPPAEK